MPFYLSEYIGAGTRANPYVAVGADADATSVIDLRPDPSRQDGGGLNACLLRRSTSFADARARFLGDDKLETLTAQQLAFLTTKLGVDLGANVLIRDVIAKLLTSPPVNGWKGLRPTGDQYEIWMGELLWSVPFISGGSSDNFNRADETPIASPWTKLLTGGSNTNLTTNQAVGQGDSMYGFSGSVTSADQFSQVLCPNMTTNEAGPTCRASTTGGGECYLVVLGGFHNFYKLVGASYTSIISTGTSEVNGQTARLETQGSSLRYYQNGVLSSGSPQTDTSVTAVGMAGMRFGNASEVLDDWQGADLAGPAATASLPLLRVG
jgi:hypothetical protein